MENKINSIINRDPSVYLEEIITSNPLEFKRNYIEGEKKELFFELSNTYQNSSHNIYNIFKKYGYKIDYNSDYAKILEASANKNLRLQLTQDCCEEFLQQQENKHGILKIAYHKRDKELILELAKKGIKDSSQISYIIKTDNDMRDLYYTINNNIEQFDKDCEWFRDKCSRYQTRRETYEFKEIEEFINKKTAQYAQQREKLEELVAISLVAKYNKIFNHTLKKCGMKKDTPHSHIPYWKYIKDAHLPDHLYDIFTSNKDITEEHAGKYLALEVAQAASANNMDSTSNYKVEMLKYKTMKGKLENYFSDKSFFEKNKKGISLFDLFVTSMEWKVFVPHIVKEISTLSLSKKNEILLTPMSLDDKSFYKDSLFVNVLLAQLSYQERDQFFDSFYNDQLETAAEVSPVLQQKIVLTFIKNMNFYNKTEKDLMKIIDYCEKCPDLDYEELSKHVSFNKYTDLQLYFEKKIINKNLDITNNKGAIYKI